MLHFKSVSNWLNRPKTLDAGEYGSDMVKHLPTNVITAKTTCGKNCTSIAVNYFCNTLVSVRFACTCSWEMGEEK